MSDKIWKYFSNHSLIMTTLMTKIIYLKKLSISDHEIYGMIIRDDIERDGKVDRS